MHFFMCPYVTQCQAECRLNGRIIQLAKFTWNFARRCYSPGGCVRGCVRLNFHNIWNNVHPYKRTWFAGSVHQTFLVFQIKTYIIILKVSCNILDYPIVLHTIFTKIGSYYLVHQPFWKWYCIKVCIYFSYRCSAIQLSLPSSSHFAMLLQAVTTKGNPWLLSQKLPPLEML